LTFVKADEDDFDTVVTSTSCSACAIDRRPHRTPNAIMNTSLGLTFGILVSVSIGAVQARDDGRYRQSPLKPWFDSLRSGKGLCCSDADGFAVSDPDWESKSGHYRVRIDNEWVDVPDDALITEPNRVGRTMVWPVKGPLGISIRCFMPGSMT
jgi:hypothetical protein